MKMDQWFTKCTKEPRGGWKHKAEKCVYMLRKWVRVLVVVVVVSWTMWFWQGTITSRAIQITHTFANPFTTKPDPHLRPGIQPVNQVQSSKSTSDHTPLIHLRRPNEGKIHHEGLDTQQREIKEGGDVQIKPGSNTSSLPNTEKVNWSSVMTKRRAKVAGVCRRNLSKLRRFSYYQSFTFDTDNHIAYCRNAKAGTTTMLGYMLELRGVNTTGMGVERIHGMAIRKGVLVSNKMAGMEINDRATTVIIARHPFARLVSAYRDKILGWYMRPLERNIIARYRNKDNINPNFQSKNEKTIGKAKRILMAKDATNNAINLESPTLFNKNTTIDITVSTQMAIELSLEKGLNSKHPTFHEFAMFVADNILMCSESPNPTCMKKVNIHWLPLHERCAPCDVNYKVIAKMETFDSDMQYLSQLAHIPPIKKKLHSTGGSSDSLTKYYFSTLTPEEREKLYQAYKYDFLLFGYEYNESDY